jgi:DNA-binding IclR family transcriptional regulator
VELEYKLEKIQFTAYTSHTITCRQALLDELHRIRRQGYAMDYEEFEYNQCCIAAPIFDYRGEAIAAITVSGTCTQIERDRVPEVGHEVVLAARKVSERMGFYANK